MQRTIEKVNALWAEYKQLQPIATEHRQRLEKKFRLEFNYNSNHMEGNTLTYGETELLLIFDDTKGGHSMREYEEMKAHDVAYQLIQQWATDAHPLTEADIKNLNKTILVKPFWKDAITPDGQDTRRQINVGDYKEYPNSVRLQNGEMFEYASPTDTPIQMGELVQWYNSHADEAPGHDEAHPLFLASLLHYRFVRIHPFDDGNGRVARLLMNYVLLKSGLPPVVIKSAEKASYLRALNAADTGDIEAFVKYIGEQLIWSLELAIKAAKGESLDEPDDLDKELALLQRQLADSVILNFKATPEVITETFHQNFKPIVIMLEEKLNFLRPYFFEIKRELIGIKFKVPFIIDETNLGDIAFSEIPDRIIYRYFMNEFRSNKDAPNIMTFMNIGFDKYYFTIDRGTEKENIFKFNYGYRLSNEEIQEIITIPVKEIIEQIREFSSNKS